MHAPTRRNPVVEPPRQRGVVARAEGLALAAEVGVAAEDPVSAFDPQRRRAIVEPRAVQVRHHLAADHVRAAGQVGALVENRARTAAPAAVAAGVNGTHRAQLAGQGAEIRMPSLAKGLAVPAELGVDAELPRALVDDHRASAVVESGPVEIDDRAVDVERSAGEFATLEEDGPAPATVAGGTGPTGQIPRRRDRVGKAHARNIGVLPGTQSHAGSAEIGIAAHLPCAAPDDHGDSAVVIADVGKIGNRLVRRERPSGESRSVPERHLCACRRHHGEGHRKKEGRQELAHGRSLSCKVDMGRASRATRNP